MVTALPAENGMTAGNATHAPDLDGDLAVAEGALSALNDAWEAAVEALGSTVPPMQLRALLAIAAAAPLGLTALAGRLGGSASAVSRLCDRLQEAGLITRHPGQPDRRSVRLSLTPAGSQVAAWVREQRRASLAAILDGMPAAARRRLVDGLRELSAANRP